MKENNAVECWTTTQPAGAHSACALSTVSTHITRLAVERELRELHNNSIPLQMHPPASRHTMYTRPGHPDPRGAGLPARRLQDELASAMANAANTPPRLVPRALDAASKRASKPVSHS